MMQNLEFFFTKKLTIIFLAEAKLKYMYGRLLQIQNTNHRHVTPSMIK